MSTLAPRLRHRVTFQEQVTERDSEGVEVTNWQTVWLDSDTELADVPAEVLTGPGREAVIAGQVNADTVARITVRWFPGLSQSWRILWEGLIYNIRTFDTDATARREWRIRCTEGMNDGQ